MDKKIKYIIAIAAFAAVMIVAVKGYDYLSKRYTPEQNEIDLTSQSSTDENTEDSSQDTGDSTEDRVMAIDFTVLNQDKEEVKLSDYFGKPIVLNFWATWCGPCQSELPVFEKAAKTYGDSVVIMMINLTDGQRETISTVEEFIEENEYALPVYYDTTLQAGTIYGASSIPLTYFISSEGEVVKGYMGALSEEVLFSSIDELLQ